MLVLPWIKYSYIMLHQLYLHHQKICHEKHLTRDLTVFMSAHVFPSIHAPVIRIFAKLAVALHFLHQSIWWVDKTYPGSNEGN